MSDGFQAHVAACDGPLVVLFQHQRADEANDGVVIGKDADDIRAPWPTPTCSGGPRETCSIKPMSGFYRDRCGRYALGSHPLAPPAGRRRHFVLAELVRGERWSSGVRANDRSSSCGRPALAASYGVIANARHRKISAVGSSSRSSSLSIDSRARGPRRPERGRSAARPAGAACWPPSPLRFSGIGSGRTMELGRSGERSIIIMRPAGTRRELRGHRQRAASKDQRRRLQRDPPSRLRFSGIRFGANDGARAFAAIDHAAAAAPALAASYGVIANARHRKISAIGLAALGLLAPNLRACARGARRASERGQQTDPRSRVPSLYPLARAHRVGRADRPAGAGWAALRNFV